MEYLAVTDRATPVDLTQHTSFNLTGGTAADILGHVLWINADLMTPVDENLIPTGELLPLPAVPSTSARPP